VHRRWTELLRLGTEIEVLLDVPVEAIRREAPPIIARAIEAFRTGSVRIAPGGGGRYGEVTLT
jgi:PHP family Zn ribbon phosphoesterase